jgi:hypothetical protein
MFFIKNSCQLVQGISIFIRKYLASKNDVFSIFVIEIGLSDSFIHWTLKLTEKVVVMRAEQNNKWA